MLYFTNWNLYKMDVLSIEFDILLNKMIWSPKDFLLECVRYESLIDDESPMVQVYYHLK